MNLRGFFGGGDEGGGERSRERDRRKNCDVEKILGISAAELTV